MRSRVGISQHCALLGCTPHCRATQVGTDEWAFSSQLVKHGGEGGGGLLHRSSRSPWKKISVVTCRTWSRRGRVKTYKAFELCVLCPHCQTFCRTTAALGVGEYSLATLHCHVMSVVVLSSYGSLHWEVYTPCMHCRKRDWEILVLPECPCSAVFFLPPPFPPSHCLLQLTTTDVQVPQWLVASFSPNNHPLSSATPE